MTNPPPVVSVLMTVFNRAHYVDQAIRSVLAQRFRDFELIVVDDHSSDGSVDVVRRHTADARVRVIVNDSNLGDYPNRMKAASVARGTYLKYVDSDDLIYPHSLAIMVEAMESHPAAALGVTHALPEEEEPYPWLLTPERAWRKQFLQRGCLNCGPSGAIMRREAFVEVGGFRDWGVLSDTDLWLRMAARWPVVLLPPGLVWWRRHPRQEFTKDDAAITYLARGFALATEALSTPENPLSAPDRLAALARARQHFARRLLSLAVRGRRPLLAWRLFRDSGMRRDDLVRGIRGYR